MKNTQQQIDREMNFFDHIDEIRMRLMRCLLVFFVGFLICYFLVSEAVMEILKAPLLEALPEGLKNLYFTSLFENFLTHLKIGAYCSIFFFSPYYFYQLWAFLVPGMHENEKKLVVPFVFAATTFFALGALFAYFVLFPVGFKFFVTFGALNEIPLLTMDAYYGTCLKLLLLFGLAFEIPVLISLLGYLGIVDGDFLRKHRKNAIILITVICALFAPPDAISMLILMVPLILFYEGAIYVVDFFGVKRTPLVNPEEEESISQALEGKSNDPSP